MTTKTATQTTTCPACSGASAPSAGHPFVLSCTSCGAVYTDRGVAIGVSVARQFVAVAEPMLANAGAAGQRFFDFVLVTDAGRQRIHGWADRATRRVVQWG